MCFWCKILLSFVAFVISLISFGQRAFNFNLEQNSKSNLLPDHWVKWGDYDVQKDSLFQFSGKFSVKITSFSSCDSFGCAAYKFDANFSGDSITLEAYMRYENVENGFVGLLLRIDGEAKILAFENMQSKSIKGSSDWTKYSITLPLSENSKVIYVGGILQGCGKAWFDNFKVLIDGTDIRNVEVKTEKIKAQLDKEFEEGSKFRIDNFDSIQINNLFKICKIWGFLKYNHPEIAKGNLNWDYELFRILPTVNSNNFDEEILNWIKSVGKLNHKNKSKLIENKDEIKVMPSLVWINDESFLTPKISKELCRVNNIIKEKTNYYVEIDPLIGMPIFKNESAYPEMNWGDTGYKLLSLFRYWNMIEYFYPYKYLINENWDEVLKKFIPIIIDSEDELTFKLSLLTLIGKLEDSHAKIWSDNTLNNYFGKQTPPLKIKIIDNKVVITEIFENVNGELKIKTGDIINSINGVEINKVIQSKIEYCPASNLSSKQRDIAKLLLRTNESNLQLSISNEDTTFKVNLKTINFNKLDGLTRPTSSHLDLDGDIGYINAGALAKGEIDSIMTKFINKKGLIIDLRCYPSDFIVFSLAKYLMPESKPFAKVTVGNIDYPGLFTFGKNIKVGNVNKNYYKGKVVILINEETQSQAEYTAMSLKVIPFPIIIGSQTAGADGNLTSIVLPGNIRTTISGIGVYYPDGRETQKVGIVPDIIVRPDLISVKEKRDVVLEKAIRVLNN